MSLAHAIAARLLAATCIAVALPARAVSQSPAPAALPFRSVQPELFATPNSFSNAWGDFDDDGDLDLWFTTVYGVASFGRPNHAVLFRNDGGFTFADATASAGLAGQPPTYQAAWADFDRDGDLDLATAGKLFENQG
ncbi:MAG: VCBS repeat-containing protein, partial [Bauldia sp.]